MVFVSTFQIFVTRFKKKLFTHFKKMCQQSFCECTVLKKNVSTFFCVHHMTFYGIFNILMLGLHWANLVHIFFDSYSAITQNVNGITLKINVIKDRTCLCYAIIILCNYYIVVS